VDHIVQTDKKPKGLIQDAKRQLLVNARYLNIPIKNGAAKRIVTLIVDGREIVRNEIEPADGTANWWAPMDISVWTGNTITDNVDKLPEESAALAAIEQSDTL
jgi:fructan beta-fructosidase